jgi:hypothetical protein
MKRRKETVDIGLHTIEFYGKRESWRDNKTGKFAKVPER